MLLDAVPKLSLCRVSECGEDLPPERDHRLAQDLEAPMLREPLESLNQGDRLLHPLGPEVDDENIRTILSFAEGALAGKGPGVRRGCPLGHRRLPGSNGFLLCRSFVRLKLALPRSFDDDERSKKVFVREVRNDPGCMCKHETRQSPSCSWNLVHARMVMSVPPNGSRLSCGALKKDSFLNLRAPSASSAC